MGVVWTQQSEYAKERRKHEAHHTEFGAPERPYTYTPYPTRMYKCTRVEKGARVFEGITARDEVEQRNLESRGFVAGGQAAALDALERQEFEHAQLAAERNYDVKHKLSEKAAAEVAEAEAAHGARHLPSVPETPIRRRGRTVKPDVTDE